MPLFNMPNLGGVGTAVFADSAVWDVQSRSQLNMGALLPQRRTPMHKLTVD